jgi:2-polyprenyl-6-methoxyphenol hydroxylase-like FAD-dependent oxidoreductase
MNRVGAADGGERSGEAVTERAENGQVDVLVVGGSLVGLTAAMLLGRHGISTLAVERHAGTAIHPRAGHFHLRTAEILRAAGLEAQVRKTSVEQYDPNGGINNVESLAGREIASYFPNLNAGVEKYSPTIRMFIDQDALEPMIRATAQEHGAQLRYRTECSDLVQDDAGVTATLTDLETGATSQCRAKYVIAADGNRSPVRNRLNIAMRGHGLLSNSVTIYFDTEVELAPLLEGRYHGVNYVTNPVLRGFFRLGRDGRRGFLVVNLVGDTARPEILKAFPDAPWANVAETIDDQRALELLRAAIGVPDLPVTVRDVAKWQAIADSAERYREGRIFLAGDAAHVVPPNGGYGGNTGVQDAYNLAWKLAYVLHGHAGPALLDTYDAERRPIGELTVEQAYTRYVTRVAPYLGPETAQPIVDDMSMEIGLRCNSSAVIPDRDDEATDPPPLHEHPDEAKGRPGSRAPHVVLTDAELPDSTLDLFGTEMTLLTPSADVAEHSAHADIPLAVHTIAQPEFAEAYGITETGAALVRPDGIVAWRARAADAITPDALTGALTGLLSRVSNG